MNILELIIIAMTVLFAAVGYWKGFVRKLASLLSLVVSVVLVSMCLPYVTEFLKDRTPVYDRIAKQCREVVESQMESALGGDSAVGTVPGVSIDLGSAGIGADSFAQTELIGRLPLPQMFREQLLSNNNSEGYQRLGVSTFQDYVVNFCATMILNVLSFIVAFLLVQIALRIVIAALDILSQAPVIGMLNRVAGLLLGLLQMLFLLWLFFMALSAMSTTETGLYLMSMVQESRLLSYLYDSNLFMRIVLQAVGLFL